MSSKRLAQIADQKITDALHRLMEDEDGRTALTWILEQCHVYESSLSVDGTLAAAKEGERQVGLRILGRLNAYPHAYLRMLERNLKEKEATKQEKRNDENAQ